MKFLILTLVLAGSFSAKATPTVLGLTGDLTSTVQSSAGSSAESSSEKEESYKEIYDVVKVDISRLAIHGEMTTRLEVMATGLATKYKLSRDKVLDDLLAIYKSEQNKIQD